MVKKSKSKVDPAVGLLAKAAVATVTSSGVFAPSSSVFAPPLVPAKLKTNGAPSSSSASASSSSSSSTVASSLSKVLTSAPASDSSNVATPTSPDAGNTANALSALLSSVFNAPANSAVPAASAPSTVSSSTPVVPASSLLGSALSSSGYIVTPKNEVPLVSSFSTSVDGKLWECEFCGLKYSIGSHRSIDRHKEKCTEENPLPPPTGRPRSSVNKAGAEKYMEALGTDVDYDHVIWKCPDCNMEYSRSSHRTIKKHSLKCTKSPWNEGMEAQRAAQDFAKSVAAEERKKEKDEAKKEKKAKALLAPPPPLAPAPAAAPGSDPAPVGDEAPTDTPQSKASIAVAAAKAASETAQARAAAAVATARAAAASNPNVKPSLLPPVLSSASSAPVIGRKRGRPRKNPDEPPKPKKPKAEVQVQAPAPGAGALQATLMLLTGCCLNVITLEFLTKYDKSAGNIITFAQFVVISLYGFFKNWDFGLRSFKARVIPLQNYVKMTSIFFVLSVVNNYAFVFNISVPLHSLFRSSSLPASIFVGWMFFSKKYTRLQVLACLLVTIGIIVTTVFESKVPSVPLSPSPCPGCDNKALPSSVLPPSAMGRTVADSFSPKVSYAIGVVFLFAALLLSAQLGHIQDLNYKSYTGSSWEEVMFYSHLLCLPAFLFLAPSIYERVLLWFGSPAVIPVNLPHLPPFSVSVWTMLLLNAITQLQCVTGVYSLTCLTSTLTANLVTTFRKFLSVMISVLYFRNPFEVPQMVGCLLVFGGVLIYGHLPSDQKGPAAMPVVQEVEEEEEEGEEEGEEREESYPVTPKSSKFQTTATSSMRKRR